MGVKKIVTDRLDRVRSFAESVRAVYEESYKKAVDASKDIEPKLRCMLDDGLHSAKTNLDNLNQSLADRAIPAFRKRAVSQSDLDNKTKKVVKENVSSVELVKKKSTSATSRKKKSVKK